MYKPHEPKKVYWTIGEVAKELGEYTSCIRFWCDTLGDYVGEVKRNKRNERRFTRENIEQLKKIQSFERSDKIEILRKLEKLKELELDLRKSKLNEMVYLSEELGLYDKGL